MASYQIKTLKGYDFFEVSSAFQKAIRRGLEQEAMYWCVEMVESGYEKYVWKRMLIMVSEDVGLAEPSAPAVIFGLYETFKMLTEKRDMSHHPERLPITHAVLYLTRCRKSRVIDWALNYHWDEHFISTMEIPDYALDKHTRRGKALGKNINDFMDDGCRVSNHDIKPLEEKYMEACRIRWANPQWNTTKKAARAQYGEPNFNQDKQSQKINKPEQKSIFDE